MACCSPPVCCSAAELASGDIGVLRDGPCRGGPLCREAGLPPGEHNDGVRRISVVGNSGSGKTTLAQVLSQHLGVPHVELDALYHGPGWTQPEADQFRHRVATTLDAAADGWVCCGNYSLALHEVVWPRADTVVVLDYPKATVMRRVVGRTVRRVLSRAELWNGNREPLRNLYAWDPERNIIRWAWVRHDVYRDRYRSAGADPRWEHLDFVVLTSPGRADEFVASLRQRT